MNFDAADIALIEIDPEATHRELALLVEIKQLRAKLQRLKRAIYGIEEHYEDVCRTEDPDDPEVLICFVESTLSRLAQAIK